MRYGRNPVPDAGIVQPVTRDSPRTGLPAWILPQLTQLVDTAPNGNQWLHEIKYDGYRMHARLDRGAVKLLTRTGLDWTRKYPAIATAVAALDARDAYLDGELCGVGPDGVTSFNIVQLASDSGNAAALVSISSGADSTLAPCPMFGVRFSLPEINLLPRPKDRALPSR